MSEMFLPLSLLMTNSAPASSQDRPALLGRVHCSAVGPAREAGEPHSTEGSQALPQQQPQSQPLRWVLSVPPGWALCKYLHELPMCSPAILGGGGHWKARL